MKQIKKYKYTLLLSILVVSGVSIKSYFSSETEMKQPETRVEIKADEVEKILELNCAKQKVEVRFDTSYVAVQYAVNILGLKLSPYDVTNTLVQTQVYQIKAGCEDFKIIDNQLFIVEPGITSVEELSSEREIITQSGEWSAVAHKAIAVRTKSMAKSAALNGGIIELGKLNVETAFANMKIKVNWTK